MEDHSQLEKSTPGLWQVVGKLLLAKILLWVGTLIGIICPLVITHELAHMLTALWFGMPVESFNIGFGPSIAEIKGGGILYHLRPIPLGGYVALGNAFTTFPIWQQLVVMSAGCIANLLCWFLIAKVWIRNSSIWLASSWTHMLTWIFNTIMKTFFLPWRVDEVYTVDQLLHSRWTRLSKKKNAMVIAYALFALNLGIFNLIPMVGALDGGKICSILLTPLIGTPAVTMITTILLYYVLHRWVTWEYGLKPLLTSGRQYLVNRKIRKALVGTVCTTGEFAILAEHMSEVLPGMYALAKTGKIEEAQNLAIDVLCMYFEFSVGQAMLENPAWKTMSTRNKFSVVVKLFDITMKNKIIMANKVEKDHLEKNAQNDKVLTGEICTIYARGIPRVFFKIIAVFLTFPLSIDFYIKIFILILWQNTQFLFSESSFMETYMYEAIKEGYDSTPYVYKKKGNNDVIHFHKEYKEKDWEGNPVKKDNIIIYHMLHHILSKETICLELPSFAFGGKQYTGIKISLLDLDPEDVCEASIISTKENIRVSNPRYIPGKNINEFKSGKQEMQWVQVRGEVKDHVEKVVDKVTKSILNKSVNFGRIDYVNIRVRENENSDGYLQIIVTDIATDLTSSIKRNEYNVNEIKDSLQTVLQMEKNTNR